MPVVQITLTREELSNAQKAEVARRATDVLADVLGKNPETTHVLITEVPADRWAIGGELVESRRASGVAPKREPWKLGRPKAGSLGRGARDLRAEARSPDAAGARAALETFYFAFNQRNIEAFESVWAPDESILLSNPLGGSLAGIANITALYRRIFEGPARVWVEYQDVTEFISGGHALFVGREHGEFAINDRVVPLGIRTTRYFRQLPGIGWRQVHHHGSIDDPETLRTYQAAVRGEV